MSIEAKLSAPARSGTIYPVLIAASLCHLLNDMIQALLPAIYPILQGDFDLSFAQVGLLTFVYQVTGSIFQPFIGLYTDRRPMPLTLPFAMIASMSGLLTLAFAPDYPTLLAGAMLLGLGSSIFHPETSRIARLSSGGAHGLAQSLFQVGGNFGAALGPLAAAFIVLPRGQHGLAWFAIAAIAGIMLLTYLSRWYSASGHAVRPTGKAPTRHPALSGRQINRAMAVLLTLLLSKWVYLALFTSYYSFYLIEKFALSIAHAQILQFVFFAAVALGTIAGGPLGDRYGRRGLIWVSILGVLPFTLLLPHVGLLATVLISVVIGLLMSSAFPAIVVYGQEILPGRVGLVSGLFFGFTFGISGIGAALLGWLADGYGLQFVFVVAAFLPALGMLTPLLPDLRRIEAAPSGQPA